MSYSKVRKLSIAMFLTAIAVPTLLTAAVGARIDVHPVGQKEIELKIEKKNINGWLTHIGWGKEENRKFSLIFTCNSLGSNWKKISFTFIPQKSGKICLYLLSTKQKGEDRWILFDNLQVTGAKIVNPGFENLNSKGNKAIGWTSRGKGYIVVSDKNISNEGTNCIKLFHDQPAIQTIEVTAGQPVTVSCMVKQPPLEKKK